MTKRIMCLLVALLLAGMLPIFISAAESAAAGSTEPSSDTCGETEPDDTAGLASDAGADAQMEENTEDEGISLLSSVPVSTTKSYQIQWIGHSNGSYQTSYYDAQGTHHTGYISMISIHKIDSKMAYCIQPTVKFGTSYSEDAANSAWMSELTANQRTAIALAIAYGYPNMDFPAADPAGAAADPSLGTPLRTDLWQISERYAATQIILWEIVMGKRSATAPYNCTDTELIDSFYLKKNPYGYRADWETLKLTYDTISEKMANHKTVPSFSAATSAAAPTHVLKYNSATGNYTITLTDSNGVLSDYDFTSSISGITFTRSGNTLTITATPEAAAKLATAQIASASGSSLEIDVNKVVTVWAADDSGQTAVQVKSSPDPVTAYLKLKAEASGEVLLKKTTNTGTNLGGWNIGLYTDAACTKPVPGSPFTTGADGTVTVSNLAAGTYYAKEQAVSDPYWGCDSSVKTVTVEAGKTATVTFTNIQYGKIRIVKAMDTDGPLDGWKFEVYREEESGDPSSFIGMAFKLEYIGTYTSTADGTILTGNLEPGTYVVKEILPDGSLYECKTENPQTVIVVAGETAEVFFTNALRPGRIIVEKVNFQGEPLAGARFLLEWSDDGGATWQSVTYSDKAGVVKGGCSNPNLAEGCLTSGEDGIVEWGNLYPGIRYRVTEVEAPEGYSLLTDYAFVGELPAENLTVELTVVNASEFTLPMTGSHTFALMPIVLALCAALGMGALLYRRKE